VEALPVVQRLDVLQRLWNVRTGQMTARRGRLLRRGGGRPGRSTGAAGRVTTSFYPSRSGPVNGSVPSGGLEAGRGARRGADLTGDPGPGDRHPHVARSAHRNAERAPARMLGPLREWLSGGVLLSHPVSRAVPSALRGLASGFGM
jgi:hypothetical protein